MDESRKSRHRWLVSVSHGILLTLCWCGACSGDLLTVVTTDDNGEPLPCRVLVRCDTGCVVPGSATILRVGTDVWFMSPGNCVVDVPTGKVTVRVERGLEYARIRQSVAVHGPTTQRFRLRRWINMAELGYRSGENHLHVDTVKLAPMLVAEDLDFGTSLTWWRGPDSLRPIPAGMGRTRTLEFAGKQIQASIYDAELEYSWGAAYIQDLPEPMPIKAEPRRPNLDYLRHAVEQGAIVHYQGGWSREVLLDALMGCVHTVNICNNNFAFHRFQPRSRYSNLLKVDGFPVYPDTDVAMLEMNTETYYRLLNCGLKLAAGAGSATGVKQAPAGYNRAYVRLEADASIHDFYEAWKLGQNFVTNGPMLFLRTAAGSRPGETVELDGGGSEIAIHVEAVSDQPLTGVEVVVNGKVGATLEIDDLHHVAETRTIQVTQGSWIAARCTVRDDFLSDDELTAYRDPGTSRVTVAPSRLRFAHTSPIYITVGGRSVAVQESIEEGLQLLAQFRSYLVSTAGAEYQASTAAAIEAARQKLSSLLGE